MPPSTTPAEGNRLEGSAIIVAVLVAIAVTIPATTASGMEPSAPAIAVSAAVGTGMDAAAVGATKEPSAPAIAVSAAVGTRMEAAAVGAAKERIKARSFALAYIITHPL